jgi:hypothetical protein
MSAFAWPQADRVTWSRSGRYLCASGAEGAVIWDARLGEQIATIKRSIGSIAWNSGEERIAVGSNDGAIELWNPVTGKKLAQWREPQNPFAGSVASEHEPPRAVFDLKWSPNGKYLGFVTQDSIAALLDGSTGRAVRTFSGHSSGIWRLAWSPDSSRFATCGQDGTIRIYNSLSGDQVAHIDHGDGKTEVHSIDWSSDGSRIATGGFDHSVRIWDSRRGVEVANAEAIPQKTLRSAGIKVCEKSADLYAQLGWVTDARRVYALALDRNVDPAVTEGLRRKAGDAEVSFLDAVRRPAPVDAAFQAESAANSRIIPLLSAILGQWDGDRAEQAVASYWTLAAIPQAAANLPLAQRYLSRGKWNVTWFPSKVDPEKDLQSWRELEKSAGSVNAQVRSLSFPYQGRGPRDILIDPEVSADGPKGSPFGMIARSNPRLPAGKWRVRVTCDGGVRVQVNGNAIIENWHSRAFGISEGEFEQPATGAAELVVENFVASPSAGFDLVLIPVGATP